MWKALLSWISLRRAIDDIRAGRGGKSRFAFAVAAGVFIANLPLYGVQTILSLVIAKRFHLHPLAIVAGAQVSTPPITPIFILSAIAIGHMALHGQWPTVTLAQFQSAPGPTTLTYLTDWLVGTIPVGLVSGLIAYAIVMGLLAFVKVHPPQAAKLKLAGSAGEGPTSG